MFRDDRFAGGTCRMRLFFAEINRISVSATEQGQDCAAVVTYQHPLANAAASLSLAGRMLAMLKLASCPGEIKGSVDAGEVGGFLLAGSMWGGT